MSERRKFTLDDFWAINYFDAIAVSPDGRRVAYALQSTDKASNENRSAIWLLHLDEDGQPVGESRQLTNGLKSDSSPVWSPDSRRMLFLSNREGEKNQLWCVDSSGGEAYRLTNMLRGVSEASWSPDGQWIAFTASAALDDDDDLLAGRKTESADEKKRREDDERIRLRTITSINYRLDGRGLFDTFSHVFVMPAPSDEAVSAGFVSIRRFTNGDIDHVLPQWTPDSSAISVLCNRDESRHSFIFINDFWLIDRESGEARCLTDNTLEIGSYSWSPDGRSVVLVVEEDKRIYASSTPRLVLVAREDGSSETLTRDFDHETLPAAGGRFSVPGPYVPQWSADGRYLFFIATDRGCAHVARLDMQTRAIEMLTSGEHVVFTLALLPDQRHLLIMQEHVHQPPELYLLPAAGQGEQEATRITHLYDRLMGEYIWPQAERISYRGANGDEIDGWLLRPVGAREGVRYPLLLTIHGGPHGAYGVGMSPIWQFFAEQGFAVFYCNPHGSTSCGEEFMRSVVGDWGGKDYQDIMLGVDECVARGVADPERLVVTGYSYGGYMSMFIIGQTGRFKAAVPMAGISNLFSFVGVSDIGAWQVAQAKGYPWDSEREAYYRERSPITHAARVTTPTLFLHPENDLRCPIEQTEQFYMRLKMMGNVPVEFVRAPGAWHGGRSKPGQWLAYWEKTLEWFKKYVEIRAEEYD
ncbi:MAG: S9 family peptidase [Ktedonobacteraceae bacterium]